VWLADNKLRTGNCRGHPRRWWVRRPGRERMATTFSWVR
jgi:hypothetical protein